MCCILLPKHNLCCMTLRNAQLFVSALNIMSSLLVIVNVWLKMKTGISHVGTETLLHILILLFAVNGICSFISWFSQTIGVAVISFILTLILEAVILAAIVLLIEIFYHDTSLYNNIGMICGFGYGVVGLFTYVAVHSYFRELFEGEMRTNNLSMDY